MRDKALHYFSILILIDFLSYCWLLLLIDIQLFQKLIPWNGRFTFTLILMLPCRRSLQARQVSHYISQVLFGQAVGYRVRHQALLLFFFGGNLVYR